MTDTDAVQESICEYMLDALFPIATGTLGLIPNIKTLTSNVTDDKIPSWFIACASVLNFIFVIAYLSGKQMRSGREELKTAKKEFHSFSGLANLVITVCCLIVYSNQSTMLNLIAGVVGACNFLWDLYMYETWKNK